MDNRERESNEGGIVSDIVSIDCELTEIEERAGSLAKSLEPILKPEEPSIDVSEEVNVSPRPAMSSVGCSTNSLIWKCRRIGEYITDMQRRLDI